MPSPHGSLPRHDLVSNLAEIKFLHCIEAYEKYTTTYTIVVMLR